MSRNLVLIVVTLTLLVALLATTSVHANEPAQRPLIKLGSNNNKKETFIVDIDFDTFKLNYKKTYPTGTTEEAQRRANFEENVATMRQQRLANPHATFAINEHFDLSVEEWRAVRGLPVGEKRKKHSEALWKQTINDVRSKKNKQAALQNIHVDFDARSLLLPSSLSSATTSGGIPANFDWRQKGVVTPVKNQGQCGSCWAFSATGNIESAWAIAGHNLTSLSEEELVQCNVLSLGCDGGMSYLAMVWLLAFEHGDIATESSYPYTSGSGVRGECQFFNSTDRSHIKMGAKISGAVILMPFDPVGMQIFVARQGTVSVAIDANSEVFMSYTSGVITNCTAGLPDHQVLITGYGEQEVSSSSVSGGKGKSGGGGDVLSYWNIKNSWGGSWGESGYVKLDRSGNQCNVDLFPVSAQVMPKN